MEVSPADVMSRLKAAMACCLKSGPPAIASGCLLYPRRLWYCGGTGLPLTLTASPVKALAFALLLEVRNVERVVAVEGDEGKTEDEEGADEEASVDDEASSLLLTLSSALHPLQLGPTKSTLPVEMGAGKDPANSSANPAPQYRQPRPRCVLVVAP